MEQPYQPFIDTIPERPDRRFFFATQQAHDWYHPLEATIHNELTWLRENVDFGAGRKFLDGGCHHGYYMLTLANGCEMLGVDVHLPNLAVCEVNLSLNGIQGTHLCHGGIAHQTGWGFYNGRALGSLWDHGEKIQVMRPQDIYPDANVVKLDIEGAEYYVIPACIDEMPHCDTWIVELHLAEIPHESETVKVTDPISTDPNVIVGMFKERGYKAAWWDRAYTGSPVEVANIVTLYRQSTFVFWK